MRSAIALALVVLCGCAKKSETCRKYEACCSALAASPAFRSAEGLPATCDLAGRDDLTCQNDYFAMVSKARSAQLRDRSLKLPAACP
jgi:hypothetical protein